MNKKNLANGTLPVIGAKKTTLIPWGSNFPKTTQIFEPAWGTPEPSLQVPKIVINKDGTPFFLIQNPKDSKWEISAPTDPNIKNIPLPEDIEISELYTSIRLQDNNLTITTKTWDIKQKKFVPRAIQITISNQENSNWTKSIEGTSSNLSSKVGETKNNIYYAQLPFTDKTDPGAIAVKSKQSNTSYTIPVGTLIFSDKGELFDQRSYNNKIRICTTRKPKQEITIFPPVGEEYKDSKFTLIGVKDGIYYFKTQDPQAETYKTIFFQATQNGKLSKLPSEFNRINVESVCGKTENWHVRSNETLIIPFANPDGLYLVEVTTENPFNQTKFSQTIPHPKPEN